MTPTERLTLATEILKWLCYVGLVVIIVLVVVGTMCPALLSTSPTPIPEPVAINVERVGRGFVEGDLLVRYHDRASGVEFICRQQSGCVLTGRSW